ncbi:putative 50S ribosomal protein-related [Melia azedarach]|uniref:50S ribosomal protein-related n=1 Tax=Melia azedarach TaxID=155640 RepID=A0ACC1XHQ7_MELAZ|nr:putative 50S ribosomal protein-related [Melia azedarach]
MAALQKFKILATQCGVTQSPTRSPRTSPLVQLPRKKTTLRMLLTRNTSSSSRRTPTFRRESLPSPKEIVAEEKKRDGDLIAQRNKLKDLFVSSFEEEEEEKVDDKILDKTELLCTMKKLHGVGSESGLNRPGWVGFRHRFLLRKAWRPMLDTIPE